MTCPPLRSWTSNTAPRAPGWDIGLILLVPTLAHTRPAETRTRSGVATVPAPDAGRCARFMALSGEPHATGITADAGPGADRLLAEAAGLPIRAGQIALSREMTRHLIRVRQRLIGVAPPEPRQLPAFHRLYTTGGVDVVIDLGLV